MSLPDRPQRVSTAKRLQLAGRIGGAGLAAALTALIPVLGTPILVGLAVLQAIKPRRSADTGQSGDWISAPSGTMTPIGGGRMNGRVHYDGGGPEDGQVHARSTEPAEGEFITETEAVGKLSGGGYRVTRIVVTPKAQAGEFSQFDAYAVWEESQPQ